jgi:putative sterol carrier protein
MLSALHLLNRKEASQVAVKFLSEDWCNAMTDALNSSEDFSKAASGQEVGLQQVVTEMPDGTDTKYYFKLDDGKADISLGEIEGAEATLTQSYETAASIQKGDLNPQNAFMQGKLKVTGNMMKLMQLQGVISAMSKAVNSVEVEY